MKVTARWIDDQWALQYTIIELNRFQTPHTGDEDSAFLIDVISTWGLRRRLSSLTSDNAADMI